MSNLENKSTKVTIVIRKNILINEEYINAFCDMYFKRYAWIKHEGDISNLNGIVEGVHYHIVGELKERQRLNTLLNKLCYHFAPYYEQFENPFGIELDTAKCIEACYQYLIHKNDKDKTQHKLEEIQSNIPAEELKTIIDMDFNDTAITARRLEVVLRANIRFDNEHLKVIVNFFGIMNDLGTGRINAYSWCLNAGIRQIKNELYAEHGLYDRID